jgi:hypothetical protein
MRRLNGRLALIGRTAATRVLAAALAFTTGLLSEPVQSKRRCRDQPGHRHGRSSARRRRSWSSWREDLPSNDLGHRRLSRQRVQQDSVDREVEVGVEHGLILWIVDPAVLPRRLQTSELCVTLSSPPSPPEKLRRRLEVVERPPTLA